MEAGSEFESEFHSGSLSRVLSFSQFCFRIFSKCPSCHSKFTFFLVIS